MNMFKRHKQAILGLVLLLAGLGLGQSNLVTQGLAIMGSDLTEDVVQ